MHDGCIVTSKEISLDSLSFRAWVSALVEQTGVSLAGDSGLARREQGEWAVKKRASGETANKLLRKEESSTIFNTVFTM